MTRARDLSRLSNSNAFSVDATNRVGIGSTVPRADLDVAGRVLIGNDISIQSGIITATNFSGNIIGVAATFTGNVSIAGTLTYEDVTNVDSIGLITARSGVVLTGGNVTLGTGVTVSGATSNTFTLSTGGSERLRVDSSGNINADSGVLYVDAVNNRVGVGSSDTSLGQLQLSGANGVTLAVKNTTGTAGGTEFCQITLNNTSGSSANFESAKIKAISTNGGSNLAHLTFENSGTERARIDSSGRLLVGTSSSRSTAIGDPRFQVEGTTYSESSVQMICNSAADAFTCAHLAFGRSKTTAIGGTGQVVDGDRLGAISWNGAQNSTLSSIAGLIECYVDGEVQTGGDTTDMPGRLVFSTTADGASSPTERMRITSAGKILYNTATAAANTAITITAFDNSVGGAAVEVNGWGNGRGHAINFAAYNTANADVVYFNTSAATVGSISITSTATAYNTSSDYRLKENIVPVIDGIIRLQQLKPSRFNFLTDPSKVVDGFIAHEVQSVVPEAVTGTKDEISPDGTPKYQGIDQSKLVPLLTAALQEAIGEIESLKARVAALESA